MGESSLSQSQNPKSFPEGVIVKPLVVHPDHRGYLSELLRVDWKDIVKEDIQQILLSVSKPGVIRGWHRHLRGQVDYLVVIQGKMEVWIQDDETKITLDEDQLKLVRIPGYYWHATKNVGDKPSIILYFLSKLYDYENPDEQRRGVTK